MILDKKPPLFRHLPRGSKSSRYEEIVWILPNIFATWFFGPVDLILNKLHRRIDILDLMMGIIYGVVQGISEFLPVSSSGHLALLPVVFSFEDPGVVFDLWLHVGTALAVIVYFKKDLFPLLKAVPLLFSKKEDSQDRSRLINIGIASVMTFIFVLFIKDFASNYGRDPLVISLNLIIFGILM